MSMACAPTTCGLRSAPKILLPRAAEAFVPLDYRVESTIAEDLSLQGKTTLHLRAGRAGERVVAVELSRHLTVDEIQRRRRPAAAVFSK